MKKLIFMLAIVMLLTSIPITAFAISEADELRNDLAIIQGVSQEEVTEFAQENAKWLEDVNSRLSTYLDQFSDAQRSDELKNLLGSRTKSASASAYFEWTSYTYRDQYWTYSMVPTALTRLVLYVVYEAWDELVETYPNIHNNGYNSLFNQFLCHQAAGIFEHEWNLEVGRPSVPLPLILNYFCNP